MKTALIIIVATLSWTRCEAQWKRSQDGRVVTFGMRDTSLFVSYQDAGTTSVWRYGYSSHHPETEADTGLNFNQGFVTSFARLGTYFFCGMTKTTGDNGPIFSSTNCGSKWSNNINAAAPIASNGTYLFSNNFTNVYRSRDTGKTWQEMPAPLAMRYATSGALVMASTYKGFYRSIDSGSSWSQITTPIGLIENFVFEGTIVFAFDGSGSLIKSVDSGAHWSPITFSSHRITALAASETGLFVGTDSGVYYSLDSGANWKNATDNLDLITHVDAMCVFDTFLFINVTNGHQYYETAYRPLRDLVPPKSGVQTLFLQDTISIYPNPTLSTIRIDFGSAAVRRVEVLDVLGASKQVLAPRESSLTLDLTSLPSGTYFLRFKTEKGTVMRKIVRE